jgi:hypothetical protein
MISAQTRSAFVARENRFTLFRIMLEAISPSKAFKFEAAKRERGWIETGWKFTVVPLSCIEPQFCSGEFEKRFA